ncbi:MAG: sulfatase-like hydrolase/transferase, partial [Rhodospirillales bacterium]|nr:sulfatase-like hydrolase/transferase [Rhodospirillales bacterium]
KYVEEVGPGETPYIAYDLNIADHACRWLKNKGENKEDKPWVLFVSFICPHFPLIVPQKYFDMYPVDEIPMPKEADRELFDTHPWWKAFNDSYIFDQYFENDHHRRTAIASYLGLCTFNDDNIGQVLAALDESGLAADTRVAYFSDHGDNMGARGLWGKSTMHEESAGIPMILRGPGLPRGKVVSTPVSLVDIYPTVLECAGASSLGEAGLPGDSLLDIATSDDNPERMVLSEYHGAASISAAYMLRKGKFKYVNYTYYDPELYDLEADPEELRNLANDDSYASILGEFEKLLRATLNPEQVDKRAKHDQEKYVEEHGGRENILMKGGIHGTPVPGEKSELIAN